MEEHLLPVTKVMLISSLTSITFCLFEHIFVNWAQFCILLVAIWGCLVELVEHILAIKEESDSVSRAYKQQFQKSHTSPEIYISTLIGGNRTSLPNLVPQMMPILSSH